MLCPDCKRNTFEPVYTESINPYIDDRRQAPHQLARREIRMFRCTNCQVYYCAFGGETAAEAYWRIIRDHAKD